MAKPYDISLEISGDYAIWTRPDTGDCPVSYPAPTYSAIKGIFESILWGPAIQVIPTKVAICKPIRYHYYQTNYGGPLRKADQIKKENNYQLLATVLFDVCYKCYANVLPAGMSDKDTIPQKAKDWDRRTTSPGHAYKSMFERRLKRGQCYSIPFLGWKEFTPNYLGFIRQDTQILQGLNVNIFVLSRCKDSKRNPYFPYFRR
jgi:CRISPR-associated protein Cas5d